MQAQKVTEKIKKLLKLAESPEPEEAASALAAAKELMKKHHISEQDLNEIQQSEVVDEEADRSRYADLWRRVLWSGVAEVEGCRSFWVTSRAMGCIWYLIGTRGKVAHAREMGLYYIGCVEKDTKSVKEAVRKHVKVRGWKFGRSFWSSFRAGMADCIRARLYERRQKELEAEALKQRMRRYEQAYAEGRVLEFFETDQPKPMVVKQEDDGGGVDQFMEGENIKVKQAKEAQISDAKGYALGYQKGMRVSLNRQVGG